LHQLAGLDHPLIPGLELVPLSDFVFHGGDDEPQLALAAVYPDDAVDLGDDRRLLRYARLEQFLDARQTLGDVGPGHTTGVEGTHGELRSRFADGLCGDDAYRLTKI